MVFAEQQLNLKYIYKVSSKTWKWMLRKMSWSNEKAIFDVELLYEKKKKLGNSNIQNRLCFIFNKSSKNIKQ